MTGHAATTDPDGLLLDRLRSGDERAFAALVDAHHALMLRVAGAYVRSPAVAEEVVQETWLAVLTGLERFEGRSTLKTWLFRILANRARTRAEREGRCAPMSSLVEDADGPAVGPDRFLPADADRWPGHWTLPPADWRSRPDARLLGAELRAQVGRAIAALPLRQQQVILLRDVGGWSPAEVCAALEIGENNQRVLLHRARSAVRAELERYLDG